MQLKTPWIQGLLCSLTLASCWGVGVPASLAAQTVTIRLGPFQQSVAIADLEKFAKTAQSFSTPQLPLRLVSELPASIKFWLGWIPDISYQS